MAQEGCGAAEALWEGEVAAGIRCSSPPATGGEVLLAGGAPRGGESMEAATDCGIIYYVT